MASNAYNLERFIEILDSWGLTDVMLPFLLIFTIVFAVLQKTNILGTGRKNYNMVISLVLALLVVIPHVLGVLPEGRDPVNIINQSILSIAVILVAVVMLLLIIGIFGGESKWTGALTGWVTIAA
ncbi:hypothetical protein GF351_03775, partial [Candidatus Woesearchaeota archaeon]|nr:hypothetical protein [Candidatus Woesearchaeota archaeon]